MLRHQPEGLGIEEIADEDAGGIAPDGIGGLFTPAHVGIVDDIVMKEGGGMDEFDDGGKGVAPFSLITAEGGRGH